MSNFIKPNPLYAEKDTAFLTMSANQTTDLTANGKIKFDTIEGNLNLVDNRITLKANTKYILHGMFRTYYSGASGYLQCSWYDHTNSVLLTGARSSNLNVSYPINFDSGTGFMATITPTTDIEVEAKILGSTLPSYIASVHTSAWIESVETHIATVSTPMSYLNAKQATAQVIPNSSSTTILFNTSIIDELGEYNSTLGRFTATYAGIYHVDWSATSGDNVAWDAGEHWTTELYINGTLRYYGARNGMDTAGNQYIESQGSATIKLGASDYIEIKIYQTRGTSTDIIADGNFNYLTIARIR